MSHSLVAVDFSPSYAFRNVSVGGRETILLIRIPSGHVGFIKAIATNWPTETEETWQEIKIDNSPWFPNRIFTPIAESWDPAWPAGTLPKPRVYDPPIVVKYSVEFIGQNNSGLVRTFESVCRGSSYEKPA